MLYRSCFRISTSYGRGLLCSGLAPIRHDSAKKPVLAQKLHRRTLYRSACINTQAGKITASTAAKPARKRKTSAPERPSNGFIYVAIDGDACPFHQDYIVRGRQGGWRAAELLTKEAKAIFGLASEDTTDLIIHIFLNQRGHTSHNWSKYRIHPDISAAFFEGLNEADSMLHAVNVGQSKEAADVKLKAGLNFHIRLAECSRIALAGLNDNAHASMLRDFITRGQRNKVVLLKTSEEIAADVKRLLKGSGRTEDSKEYGLSIAPLPEDLFQPYKLPPFSPPTK